MELDLTEAKHRLVKKGEIIQHQGNIITKGFYVKKGLLRSYSIDENGKISVFMFTPEGWLISDIQSHNQPAELFIDALEDGEIVEINTSLLENQELSNEQLKARSVKLLRRISVLQKGLLC